jgi:DNA polymerase (family 10)
MDKEQVSEILEEIALLLELKGENPFKALAYAKAARVLDHYDGDLARLVAENRLGELPGIGDALREKITTLVITGRLEYHEALRASVPEGLLTLLEIPALGSRKIKALHEKLGITSVIELEAACRERKVRGLPGFGAKTEEKIIAGIEQSRAYSSLFRYGEIWAQAEEIREELREHEGPRLRRLFPPARRSHGMFHCAARRETGDQSRTDQIECPDGKRHRRRFARRQRS